MNLNKLNDIPLNLYLTASPHGFANSKLIMNPAALAFSYCGIKDDL